MEQINNISNVIKTQIKIITDNPYIMAIIKIAFVLYAAQIAPRPPAMIATLFQNTFFKMLCMALIMIIADIDFQLAIILAIVFVISMNMLSGRGALESFSTFSKEYTPYGNSKLIEPVSVIYPGCIGITMDDLLKAFDGDHIKMQNTVQYTFQQLMEKSNTKDSKELLMKMAYYTGLPYNVDWTKPESAPFIATILLNAGFQITDKCTAPH